MNHIISYLFIDHVEAFSTFLVGLLGLSTLILYRRQRKDKKTDVARILLTEIRNAEQRIEEIRGLVERGAKDFPHILPNNSWRDFSYLFAADFDQDELQEISVFYSQCEAMQESSKKDNDFFWVTTEHRAEVYQDKLATIYELSYDRNSNKFDEQKFKTLKENFLDKFADSPHSYAPEKTVSQLKHGLAITNKITTTSAGQKLKRLAKEHI
ncbi:MAG: hypothetical protein H6760_01015 [Candidatus Nomurabacteria bacterium]|nr:MAG: hypothetical protein H6760_01015 [Candidatus Nomurabacteria bacterium]